MSEEKTIIEGVKLIEHNMAGYKKPDDPVFGPFLLEMTFRVPEFMVVSMTMIYGREHIKVRGKTRADLDEFVKVNDFTQHPRLQSMTITDTATNTVTKIK